MDTSKFPQYLAMATDALLCLIYITGAVAGVIALTRKQARLGILAVAGFLLLGLNLVLNYIFTLVIFPAIMRGNGNVNTYYWLNLCKSPIFLLGAAALVVIVFTTIGRKAEKTAAEIPEIPPIS